ncbi:RrF2 family transcriptional regulator [Flagellimonas nanhaiensis]|uniref:Rrf2 family transcriptional regulator n=1 Tax=Flagellimonas nanhaiensis TaxID=2292706 RepID=A0A371JS47_9FLAO|nr:Rrf2 family transcriptional regulator [Allomuricauda nanhaiensis]RDY60618.1 Rrf2 family transcriptional regulator [Allomuricauda nanhaiensis]
MLSNSAKYALKAVLYLSLNSNEEEKLMTKDISEKINVPKSYLAKILQDLSRHGVIASSKGPKGGFYLHDNNKKISLIDIIEVIDGKQRLSSCILGFHECDSENPCVLHDIMGGANNQFVKSLEETTLEDLIADLSEGSSVFPVD